MLTRPLPDLRRRKARPGEGGNSRARCARRRYRRRRVNVNAFRKVLLVGILLSRRKNAGPATLYSPAPMTILRLTPPPPMDRFTTPLLSPLFRLPRVSTYLRGSDLVIECNAESFWFHTCSGASETFARAAEGADFVDGYGLTEDDLTLILLILRERIARGR